MVKIQFAKEKSRKQLELSASNTVKVDYRLPVTCSDFNSTTVNSLELDFIDLLPVTLSISYRCLNVVSNTDLCTRYVVIIIKTGVACFEQNSDKYHFDLEGYCVVFFVRRF